MDRARRAAITALVLALAAASIVLAGGTVAPPLAATVDVSWPTSTLVVSEVMTGAVSASDEFVELANAGTAPVDLAGMEIVYVTATGGTVTRKAIWTESTVLGPGQRLLLANVLGSHAGAADATYSGGLSATGGALVLRVVGGAPIDAIGWGDATNAFVEGSAASAPPAGSSIERRPGASLGNGTDTNDNAADWFVQAAPSPQNLASPPVPSLDPTPTPTLVTPTPIPTADPTGTPGPTTAPSAFPTPEPTETLGPTPTGEPEPSLEPTIEPTPTVAPTPTVPPTPSPTPSPTPAPTPAPTPSPVPTATPSPSSSASPSAPPTPSATASVAPSSPPTIPIADARGLPAGASAVVRGILTTGLGLLEGGRGGFVQDDSAGIALYLDMPASSVLPAGTVVVASGTVDERYGQRTLRVAIAAVAPVGSDALPEPLVIGTGDAGEADEGRLVRIAGTTVGSPSTLADGIGLLVDDGSGQLRAIVAPTASTAAAVPSGTRITAVGPLGQRDSTGTGLTGYRLFATEAGSFEILPAPPPPSPSPSPTAPATPAPTTSPTPTPTPAPTATTTPAPTAAPTPTASADAIIAIAAARARPVGSTVLVRGVVTAEPGRLGLPPLLAIQDGSGGVAVRLPDGAPAPGRGHVLEVRGKLAAPYGQLEVRPTASGIAVVGSADLPASRPITGAALGEHLEGLLVTVEGELRTKPARATSGDISLDLASGGGTIRVMADASSGVDADTFTTATTYRIQGVVGQRASRTGSLDGYRVWLRDSADVAVLPGAGGTGQDEPAAHAAVIPIARALLAGEGVATVEGIVTAEVTLLDATGRRLVVEDASAAVEVLLPAAGTRPSLGARLRVTGTMGRAYGAPRLKAESVRLVASGAPRSPTTLLRAPGAADEWRLVRLAGTVLDVRRLGDRWLAEVAVGGERVVVLGLAGAGIPVPSNAEGRTATVTGIVKRPHPSATDRRFAILPRGVADLALGPARAGASTTAAGGQSVPRSTSPSTGAGRVPGDADLADLDSHRGLVVRVGGLVVDLVPGGFTLDDGTAVGRVVLRGEAADYLPLIEPGDALNAIGRVELVDDASSVIVEDPAGLIRVGDPGSAPAGEQPAGSAADTAAGHRPDAQFAGFADPFGTGVPGVAGLASVLVLTGLSLLVTGFRRQHARQLVARRTAARLAAFVGPRAAAGAEHDPSGPRA